MNVTMISSFRNAAHYIPLYFAQVEALNRLLCKRGDHLSLLLGYGDSTDDTDCELFETASLSIGANLIDCTHGGPSYGSIVHPERFAQLAYMGNRLAACIPDDADVVAWCESDLLWDAPTLVSLIDLTATYPAVAPMIMDGPESFYDTFAHRRNGVRFTKTPPYHADLERCCDGLLQLDSAGSVLVLDGDLARQARFTEEEVIVGYSKSIYRLGGSVWLDTSLQICHP